LAKARHVIDTTEDPATPPEVAKVAKQSAQNLTQPGAVVDREHRAVREAEQAHAEKAITDAIDECSYETACQAAGCSLSLFWSCVVVFPVDLPVFGQVFAAKVGWW
jgi:hypothetical protein